MVACQLVRDARLDGGGAAARTLCPLCPLAARSGTRLGRLRCRAGGGTDWLVVPLVHYKLESVLSTLLWERAYQLPDRQAPMGVY